MTITGYYRVILTEKTENVLIFLKLLECLTSLGDFEMFLTF